MLFAVDIGGTKTLLALIDQNSSPWRIIRIERHESRAFSLGLLTGFLAECGPDIRGEIEAAGFSLAGPFDEDGCHMTNLGFRLDFSEIRHSLGNIATAFANDLVATAHGLTVLPPGSVTTLRPGASRAGFPKAVLSLGTGLGQSALLSPEEALPSEGGHTDFAPLDETQQRLWQYLQARFGHVSYERLLSGSGLQNIYAFVRSEATPDARLPEPVSPADITACLQNPAAYPPFLSLCRKSMELYCAILGAKAGNLALETMAHGGLYLAGGITPHILPYLNGSRFYETYGAKGRFSEFLSRVPLYAVTDDRAALWGASALAQRELLRRAD